MNKVNSMINWLSARSQARARSKKEKAVRTNSLSKACSIVFAENRVLAGIDSAPD
jgi:hypothetical protein